MSFPSMPEEAVAHELGCAINWEVHTRRWLVDEWVRKFSEASSNWQWAHHMLWRKQHELMLAMTQTPKKPALIQRMEDTVVALEKMRDAEMWEAAHLKDRLVAAGVLVPIVEEPQEVGR